MVEVACAIAKLSLSLRCAHAACSMDGTLDCTTTLRTFSSTIPQDSGVRANQTHTFCCAYVLRLWGSWSPHAVFVNIRHAACTIHTNERTREREG
uniref:Putative secreted protein n=1 Tax=Anopheles darlingi TaxID=43151 RepID=A0A2M4D0U1_ANODA